MEKEQLAEQIHLWYLEVTKELHPESYNPNAQKSYADLTEEQKYMDRYLAGKFLDFLAKKREEIESMKYRDQFAHDGDIYSPNEINKILDDVIKILT